MGTTANSLVPKLAEYKSATALFGVIVYSILIITFIVVGTSMNKEARFCELKGPNAQWCVRFVAWFMVFACIVILLINTYSWFRNRGSNNKKILLLKKCMSSFYRSITKTKSRQNLWTTFNHSKKKLTGPGYAKGFEVHNARSTNKHRDRTAVVYAVNKFLSPGINSFFLSNGIEIDQDKYALSSMLQFIWRSAIRDGKEIWVCIPSSRMRILFEKWLVEVTESTDSNELNRIRGVARKKIITLECFANSKRVKPQSTGPHIMPVEMRIGDVAKVMGQGPHSFAYKMRLEAMNRQGQRTDLTCSPVGNKLRGRKSSEELAETVGESKNQIFRHIRLTYLIPGLLELVDNSVLKEKGVLQMAMRPAVELSYLTETEQQSLLETMQREDCTPSHEQAIKLRKFSQEGRLDSNVILSIMQEEKPNQKEQFRIPRERINKYFAPGTPAQTIEGTIVKALELYRKRQRDMAR